MRFRLFLFLSLLGLFLAGCSGGGGGFSKRSSGGEGKNIFRYPIVTNPTTLDPAIVQDGDTIDLLQQVYEPLLVWNDKNEPVGALAERWEVDEAGTTYTFFLKKGAKFHSGREVTAEDVKWSIERAANPKLASATVGTYLSEIVGLLDKLNGKAKEVSGVKVVDSHTVAITIDKPRPYWIYKMTFLVSAVLDKDVVPADSEIKTANEMVGTGPFVMADYQPDQIAVLKRNESYHGGPVPLEGIERPVVKDALTRLNKFKAGEIDLVMLERQDVKALQSDAAYKDQLHFYPRPALWYVGLNPLVYKPFADKRVRQAFAMAINRQNIVDKVLGGVNEIANGIVPPGCFGFNPDSKALPYDPAKARQLLAEAGYPGGKGLPQFELTYREQRPDIDLVATAVASDLKENLGINVVQKQMEWRAYLEKHTQNRMGFFHMRWGADYLDAENFLSTLLASYGPENHVGYKNDRYDALCREADTTMDPAKRVELYKQAEAIVIDDAPFIPIYFQRDAELISPKVKGLRESLFGHLPHTTTTLE
jgi:oligopeptide transport system substrate-binding protein